MQRIFFPEILLEFSLGHAVKPVTGNLTNFIISMFIRVNTKKIQIFTKQQEFTANPNQNLPSQGIFSQEEDLVKFFIKRVKKSSRCQGSFLLQEKRVLIPKGSLQIGFLKKFGFLSQLRRGGCQSQILIQFFQGCFCCNMAGVPQSQPTKSPKIT